jgi:O-methyltransferase involved in polyketide biosynthesis
LPAPQAYKEKVLKEDSIKDPENLTRIACDLTDDNWIVALERAGWDPTAPTLYILEGLVDCMTTEQAKHLLASIPSVPQSRIIVTIIEPSLQKAFERYAPTPWKTNLAKLQKVHALNMAHDKLYRNAAVPFPERYGLNVHVPWPTARNFWDRIIRLFNYPCERILEFEAVYHKIPTVL